MSFLHAFLKKYDNDYNFFHELFPEALSLLQKSLLVLDKAVKRGDWNEWCQTIKAIQSVSKDMCFKRLIKLKVDPKKPNRKDYYTIMIEVNKIANFQ
jgi:hypothetical protein